MTVDGLALSFAAVALAISVLTGKRLALVSSVFFFTTAFLGSLDGYHTKVLSMIILNFSLFVIAVMEYRRTHYSLPMALSWLFAGFVLVSGTYSVTATDVQGHILIAMSVIELILLSTLEGCRNVWTDIGHTISSIRRRHNLAHVRDSSEG